MSELGFNILGVITGVIGMVAVIPPLTYWFWCYLPTPKLREVEQRFKEAEAHFEEVLKSGLLTEVDELHGIYATYWSLQFRIDDARAEVYNIRTMSDELACWWKGLSSDMVVICHQLAKFRARLSKSSSRERRALAAAGYTARFASWSASREHLVHPIPGSSWSPAMSILRSPPAPVVVDGPQIPPLRDYSWPPTPFSQSTESPTSLPSPRNCAASADVKRHTISDDDLRHLLTLALPRTRDAEGGRRQRAARQAVLKRFGKQLAGGHPWRRNAVSPELGAMHGRFKEAKQFRPVSHAADGVSQQNVVDLRNYLHLDPASLTPQRAGGFDGVEVAPPDLKT
ncbi:hypothetical protein PYCCODRAFT_1122554 [Trametes coccinea BRFM310]|uniref:Uncharacterized protein n=1 Tax=Trametes coccinea (strain BRFM310) TaxID=1353009 RepID=A0A1Y2I8Z2_TRAC3|nr:hypothetical protein PYCCODRAFT_1122554 [Trametes coccinea BRFM310]